jgi:hypothetical protein
MRQPEFAAYLRLCVMKWFFAKFEPAVGAAAKSTKENPSGSRLFSRFLSGSVGPTGGPRS